MRRKSKFVTFILSFIPGLSHFYLGYADRGFLYLLILGMLCVGTIGLAILTGADKFLTLLVGIPIIWLVALIDAFSIINTLRYGDSSEVESNFYSEEARLFNKKIITLALSIIPGAGHMYLGYQKKGLIFMAGFFFTIFFMGWLNLSFLLFILPLIWFYSFFDAFHTFNGNNVEDMDISNILPSIQHKHIGIGLIVLGVLIGFQNALLPVARQLLHSIFDYNIIYRIESYIQTIIVSLIFIAGGIKILKGKKVQEEEIEGDVEDED
ncbi:MAG: hypothetical protein GX021_09800 [Tissierellia bacterium]|nr:hypothetical protein [Tissierellia bacterium]